MSTLNTCSTGWCCEWYHIKMIRIELFDDILAGGVGSRAWCKKNMTLKFTFK